MTGRAPRVSVVMSVYDGADHVRSALDSVLAQDFDDFELLVVDDGSTDATPAILATCSDPRLRVLRQPNRGYVVAWQRALAEAAAPLIARMDADDVADPARLARQVAYLDAHPDVGLLGTGGRVIDDAGADVRPHVTYAGDFALRLALLRGNPFLHGSVVYRRSVFDAAGGYRPDHYPAEDYDLWCRMALTGARIANLPDELYAYRRHAASVSATEQRRQERGARAVRDAFAPALAAELLTPAAVRAAALEYAGDPDPRVRAEWPEALRLLELALAREARAGRVVPALRTMAAAVAVAPGPATTTALREVTRFPARARRRRRAVAAPDATSDAARLRVLFVLESLGPGGTERSTALLLEPLRRRGIDAEVVCLRHADDGDEARVARDGVPVHVLGARSLPGRVVELRSRIRNSRPDVVHTAIYEADVVGRLAASGTGVPVVSSLISTPYDRARRDDPRVTPWKLEVARLVDGFTARHCTTRLHAVSAGTAVANVRDLHLDPTRVTVVERGRPIDEFTVVDPAVRAAARARLGVADTDRVVLSLGRQAFQKSFPDLVAAAATVVAAVPAARVWIAGAPGPATDEIDTAHRALPDAVRDRVEVLGYRTDVPDLLHACDVFVMPSRWEGTAGAVLEAMACGLPVVSTDVEGLRGVVTDGREALIVPVGDRAALGAAVVRVLDDPALAAALGAAGRHTFEARFTLEPSADGMATLYREIAAQGRRRARR